MIHRFNFVDGVREEGCGGRVFVDRAFSSDLMIELACVECGWRKMLDAETNALGSYLSRVERRKLNAV